MFDLVSFIPRAIMQGIPLLFGSTGETLTEKSGNLNLGIAGIMYVGGISGVIGAFLYEQGAGGAVSQRLCYSVRRAGAGDQQDARLRQNGQYLLGRRRPVLLRHHEIHYDDVWPMTHGLAHGACSVVGLGDDFKVGLCAEERP